MSKSASLKGETEAEACVEALSKSSWVLLKHFEHPLSDVVGERVEVLVERHPLRGHGVEDGHGDLASVESAPDGVQNLT